MASLLVMVQREVGERLAAGAGDEAYGAVSVKVAYWATASVVGRVSPTVFIPGPGWSRCWSAWTATRGTAPPGTVGRARHGGLRAALRRGAGRFAHRRKMLRRSLEDLVGPEAFDGRRRGPDGPGRGARPGRVGAPGLVAAGASAAIVSPGDGAGAVRAVTVDGPGQADRVAAGDRVRDDGYHLLDVGDGHPRPGRHPGDRRRAAPGGTEVAGRLARRAPDVARAVGRDAGRQPGGPGAGRAGRTARVRLVKRIPPGAGLGGGSADAAAVLRWAGCTDPAVAAGLGADVPFCVSGGRALVTGIGEEVEPCPSRSGPSCCCCRPSAWTPPPCTGPTTASARAGRTDPGRQRPRGAASSSSRGWPAGGGRAGAGHGRPARLAGSGSTWFVEGDGRGGRDPGGEGVVGAGRGARPPGRWRGRSPATR